LLLDPIKSRDKEAIKSSLLQYHQDALAQNAARGKKTGNLRRIVYLLSTNPKKSTEFVRDFDRYRIEVLRGEQSDLPGADFDSTQP